MKGRTKSQGRSSSKQRTQRRSQRGGSWGPYPDSAWGFQLNNLGNGWTQFMNSLSLQPGQNLGTIQSNNIVPIKNINAQDTTKMITGGKKHRHKRHNMRHMQQMQMQARGRGLAKKGGYFGPVVEQAVVPLALLGMQQTYGKRHTRRHGSSKRSRTRRH
jgi:hypothetical protein